MLYYDSPSRLPQTKQNPAFTSLCFRGKRGYPQQPRVPQPKTFGGIIRTSPMGATTPTKYVIVQGRYTKKWSFPKGHSNYNETPLECSKREIYEETGIETLPTPSNFLEIGYGRYFIFDLPAPLPLDPKDKHEIINTKWATLEEMGELSLNADVNLFLKSTCAESSA